MAPRMGRTRLCAPLLLLCLLGSAVVGAVHTSGWEDLPSPQSSPAGCGRTLRSSVCDPDRLLSRKGADAVDRVLQAIRRGARPRGTGAAGEADAPTYRDAPTCGQSPGSHGYEVALAVVRRAGGAGSAAARAERLAKKAHDTWGVGDKCGSGVVIFVAVDDRQMYISTGATASQAAPDESLDLVLDRMRPLLRVGDIDAAALEAARGVGEVLAGRLSHRLPLGAWVAIFAIFAGFVLFQRWSDKRRRARYMAAKRQLTALEQAAAAAKAARFAATTCPICMEEFAHEERQQDGHSVDGAGPSSSSSVPPLPADAAPGLKKELLRCGHAFCTPCLSRALAIKLACPICRQPPDRDAPPLPPLPPQAQPRHSAGPSTGAPPPSSCAAAMDGAHPPGGAAAGADMHVFLPELVFRLRRVQLLFPEFVTPGMVDRWALNAPTGEFDFTQDATFIRMEPGRGGGGGGGPGDGHGGGFSSFGGGNSRGGGGRGSSW